MLSSDGRDIVLLVVYLHYTVYQYSVRSSVFCNVVALATKGLQAYACVYVSAHM